MEKSALLAIKYKTRQKFINDNFEILDEIVKEIKSSESLMKKLPNITKQFPLVPERDIIMLWMVYHGVPSDIAPFKKISPLVFKTALVINDRLREFKVEIDREHKKLAKQQEYSTQVLKNFEKIKKHPIGDMTLTGIKLSIKLAEKYDLINVFDHIQVSNKIPFVMYKSQDETFVKVYSKIRPAMDWSQRLHTTDEYLFIKIEDTEIFWDNSAIYIDAQDKKRGVEIQTTLFDSLGMKIKIENIEEEGVKGFFNIENFIFKKYVLVDMIMNDPTVSSVLFVNENRKTSLEKQKFYIHFDIFPQKLLENSLTFLITIEEKHLRITIQKAVNEDQITQFRNIFASILTYYTKNESDVEEIYKELGVAEKPAEIKQPKIKKTKELLSDLTEALPEMFPKGFYARSIGPNKFLQPQVYLDQETALEFEEDHGKNRILRFPPDGQSWFVCNDKKNQTHIYPGLKANKAAKKKDKDPEKQAFAEKYQEKYPCLPACYVMDQITNLKGDCMKQVYGQDKDIVEKKKQTGYKKKITEKPVEKGQTGFLPTHISDILPKDMVFERIGVPQSPNSFLHCVLKATDENYATLANMEYLEKYVQKQRLELVKLGTKLNIARQEFYDSHLSDIEAHIKNVNSYLDPSLYIRILELKYDCNIFMYEVDAIHPAGQVSLPRFKHAHLQREINLDKPSIIIIKYSIGDKNYPYQCEIVRDITGISTKYLFDKNVTKICWETLKLYNRQYLVQNVTAIPINPQPVHSLFKSAVSQGIDSSGKTFRLNFKTFTMYVSPMAPLPIKEEPDLVNVASLDDAYIKNMEKMNRVLGTSPDKMALYIQVSIFNEAFIPLKKPYDKKIKVIESPLYELAPPGGEKSELEEYQNVQKMALYLKEYALYTSAMLGTDLSKDNFIVMENAKYDLEQLRKRFILDNNVMYKDGKLIVPSKIVRDKLIDYVSTFRFNHPTVNYADKKFVAGLLDFKTSPTQLVFSNIEDFVHWMHTENVENIVSHTILPLKRTAYFYSNANLVGGRLCIIQNVLNGDLERAARVAQIWGEKGYNVGFNATPKPETTPTIHELDGNVAIENVNVLKHEGKYSAILLL